MEGERSGRGVQINNSGGEEAVSKSARLGSKVPISSSGGKEGKQSMVGVGGVF